MIESNLRDGVALVTTGTRWVQACLNYLGYYQSSVDGMYREETEKGVKAFQKASCWQQRDYVTLGVVQSMLEVYYYSGRNLGALLCIWNHVKEASCIIQIDR